MLVTLLKSLADETRLEIIRFLLTGRKNVTQIVEHVKKSQPNTSLAIKQLSHAGLIIQEKEGRLIFYKIRNPEAVKQFLKTAERLM